MLFLLGLTTDLERGATKRHRPAEVQAMIQRPIPQVPCRAENAVAQESALLSPVLRRAGKGSRTPLVQALTLDQSLTKNPTFISVYSYANLFSTRIRLIFQIQIKNINYTRKTNVYINSCRSDNIPNIQCTCTLILYILL